jgi:hypothetical protein
MKLALLFVPGLASASFTSDIGVYQTDNIWRFNNNSFQIVQYENMTWGNPYNTVPIVAGLPLGPREADPFDGYIPAPELRIVIPQTPTPWTPTPAPSDDTAVPEPGYTLLCGLLLTYLGVSKWLKKTT